MVSKLEGDGDGGQMMSHVREWKEVLLTWARRKWWMPQEEASFNDSSVMEYEWETSRSGADGWGRPTTMNGGDRSGGGGAPWGCWTGTSTASSTEMLDKELDGGAG
jgi:hypothetical protein